MRRWSPRWLVLSGAALLAAVLFMAYTAPAGDYLFLPNTARPIASKVDVQGGDEPRNGGGIYYVEVTLRKVRWLERLAPFLRPDGSSLVPARDVTPPGETFKDRIAEGRVEMNRSEEIASAVALRAAGKDVVATPQGALVEWVAIDAPAAKVLESGDVIVEAGGHAVRTPEDLRRAMRPVESGADVALRVRRNGKLLDLKARTVAAQGDPKRAIIGIQVSQDAKIRLPLDVSIDLGNVGGPSAGLPFALQIYQELGHDVDHGHRIAATGAIELDGTIVPVGGLKQKTYGARSAGADVFLVPAGETRPPHAGMQGACG